MEFLFRTLNIADPDVPGPGTDPMVAQIKELLLQGQKIQAIALYRRETGASLADAMRAVERVAQAV
ncbi:MAG: hypothetical protein M3021_07080 [Actinomycetota bacterium]|nr:hypothetical protein [Actinomycetota bacterium]